MYNSYISIIITGPIDDRTFESIDSYYDQGFEEVIDQISSVDYREYAATRRDYFFM